MIADEQQPDDPQRAPLMAIMRRLESEADDRVKKRRPIEERWLENLRQYHGEYSEDTLKRLKGKEASQLNINLTRPKTDAMSAKLMDLLFPTDERNWGIKPTPVPELTQSADQAVKAEQAKQAEADAAHGAAEQAVDQANEAGDDDPAAMERANQAAAVAGQKQDEANAAKAYADQLRAQMDEASRRAELMQTEIEDQFKECHYQINQRDVIEDACRLGTGVSKGPVTGDAVRRGWKQAEDGQFSLQMSSAGVPAHRWVNVWDFFPSMDVSDIRDSEGVHERHLMNKKQLRRTARLPGFDKDAIRRLLRLGPSSTVPWYMATLRNIKGEQTSDLTGDIFQVWEYNGPMSAEDMQNIAEYQGDEELLHELQEVDPLEEMNAVVWFCQGELLKFAIYPLDSGECMYSVFNLHKDEYSIFGYGVPDTIRDPVSGLNAAVRAMMDNAAIASGPQILVKRKAVSPQDGVWRLEPNKFWDLVADDLTGQQETPFATFDIPMRQAELANIIALCKEFIDVMSGLPEIAQGEQGATTTQTATGMSLLMSSANIVFRRIVKNYDDDMTTPNIRRSYDYNMQFSPKDEIKGDYTIDARGSSVLLVREMQSQNLFMIATQLGGHPVFGPMLNNKDLLRKLLQSHMISSDDVMLTDEEIDAILMQAATEQESAEDQLKMRELEIREMESQTKLEIAKLDAQTRMAVARMQYDASMEKAAADQNDRVDEREFKERLEDRKIQAGDRKVAVEVVATERLGPTGGGLM